MKNGSTDFYSAGIRNFFLKAMHVASSYLEAKTLLGIAYVFIHLIAN